jgi:hypothetical protein
VKFPVAADSSSGLAMPWITTLPNTNLNEVRRPGFYAIATATTNAPFTTGPAAQSATMLVQALADDRVSQAFCHNNGEIWHRVYRGTVWSAWQFLVQSEQFLLVNRNFSVDCFTSAAISAKSVDIVVDGSITFGSQISVRFVNGNTVTNPTLTVIGDNIP